MSEYDDSLWQSAMMASSGVNQLAGTIGEYKSEKERNELQRELAYERNLWESEEAEKARDFEREMFERKIEYEDPSNKRELLQKAGVNPYSLYGASISTPSSGTPSHNPMQSADLVTEGALGKGLQNLAMNQISMIGAMSQARKNNADAEQQELKNIYVRRQEFERSRDLGYIADMREIDAINKRNQKEKELANLDLQNENLQTTIELTEVQKLLAQYDLDFLKPQEYEKVIAETGLFLEKQITEQEYREHMRRMDKNGALSAAAQMISAKAQSLVAPAQKAYYEEAAAYQSSLADLTSEEWQLLKEFGPKLKKMEVRKAMADCVRGFASAEESYQHAKKYEGDIYFKDWEEFSKHPMLWPFFFSPEYEIGPGQGVRFKTQPSYKHNQDYSPNRQWNYTPSHHTTPGYDPFEDPFSEYY